MTVRLIGRKDEIAKIKACVQAGRNLLLEGPVGSGKTHLALAAAELIGRPVFRVDGDSRYTEQKLTGWFDPPSVMREGYSRKSFVPGPLIEAMRAGGVLFVNELNRLPEGVQNVLLPSIDEGLVVVPRLGEIKAEPGFLVIATQNPGEFVATTHLSEAILDRFELIRVDYQTEEEEVEIVCLSASPEREDRKLASSAVRLARLTRTHPRVKRGASVRAAQGVYELCAEILHEEADFGAAFTRAALLALPTRIELNRDVTDEAGAGPLGDEDVIRELVRMALEGKRAAAVSGKKKT